jgi:Cys-tRNA(Pro) deacylase
MAKVKSPVTAAIRVLRQAQVAFGEHPYQYVEKGGTAHSARELGLAEESVVKTLILEDEAKEPLVVLMHGDRQLSTRELARAIGVKSVSFCTPETARRHSGYLVGGTSPFGTRKLMPVYLEETILFLPLIYINGGSRGYLVSLQPSELVRVLKPVLVRVGI